MFVYENFSDVLNFVKLGCIGYGAYDSYFQRSHLLCARYFLACIFLSLMYYNSFGIFNYITEGINEIDVVTLGNWMDTAEF